ncbi:hypothetical protein BB561_001316 [Smittium simulii]|uniref:Very-long-chain (3R)-3-hydroxyacyl-CoA dehydratase n=1 Tax=Smittium simulii TaxID=133385 RepID=A0A2T9YV54_9FUNG|nr:hypothetical protein BB561_001316 [Smittium simulii]
MSKGQPSSLVKNYLIAYNILSAVAWGYILLSSIVHFTSGNHYTTLFERIGSNLAIIQTMASMEIAHSALGFVSSGVVTTASQVFSRLFLVWTIEYLFPQDIVTKCFGFTVMVFAWSITECIRYPYYALSLLDIDFYPILWARYSLFYVLYPMGVWGEISQVIRSLDLAYQKSQNMYYFLVFMMVIYLPSFNSLYRYMVKQRAKYIGAPSAQPAKSAAASSKSTKAKKL